MKVKLEMMMTRRRKRRGVKITIFISSLEAHLSETMHIEYYFHKTQGSPGQ